jgi:hypothetical protein
MPKIVLRNTETGKNEEFEPVDAREVLRTPNTIYARPPEEEGKVGLPEGVNIPQLQGADAEMQVGLSIEKYGRSNVVKATPGNPEFSRPPPAPEPPAEVRAAPIAHRPPSPPSPPAKAPEKAQEKAKA